MAAISGRLRALAEVAGAADEYWDVCCDHGLLGLWLLETHPNSQVHFVDQVSSVMESLQEKLSNSIARRDPGHRAVLHSVDGRQLQKPLNGVVIIAGVGGELIFSLLRTWMKRHLLSSTRIVLGPHKDEEWLEEQLASLFLASSWSLQKKIVLERGRGRVILILNRIK